MTDRTLRTKLRKLALTHGIDDFRSGQEETMLGVLRGEDTLAIMPTGAGKSLCYQLPAQLLSGMTIVVSPLISLMKDQHEKIVDMGFASQHLSSELTRSQTRSAIRLLGEGRMDIQFVTPEKLESREVIEAFRRAGVSLFVVDEAHCISEWGHDFRPAYLTLSKAIEELGHPTVLALTATATPQVTGDIQERLHFRPGSHVVRISYRRENLLMSAREFAGEAEKQAALMRVLGKLRRARPRPSGIIYCATIKQTEQLAASLTEAGIRAARYHGRMKRSSRRRAQERFMKNPGVVMVATSAFGMGIDKPDVRFVINYQIPNSVESYYQEVGRAGRDGKTAYGILFYTRKDRTLQRLLALRKYPSLDHMRRAVEAIYSGPGTELDATALEAAVGKKKLGIILKQLERGGFLTERGRKIHTIARPTDQQIELLALDWDSRKRDDRQRLEDVIHYVHTKLCRWYYLLKYFGETLEAPCQHCDNCRRGKGWYVRHSTWGLGEVVQRIGPNLKVLFPGVGEKVLREDFVQPAGLKRVA